MFSKLNQKKMANAIRCLSIDAIQAANSGHPGMPMGMADIAAVLWHDFLVHNPNKPNWINRDRFILSNGHGSMLHYALLHLTGYKISINDLQHFRQLHSITPGHPEYGHTPGIEATTGPLGQGLGMAVGLALAEQLLAKQFNTPDFGIIDHHTYCFVGDGCLMEGISHEVCSLAGTLGLNKLIVFWDNNKISIDGSTDNWFTEDIVTRFTAYGWEVIKDIDGHDPASIFNAITAARASLNKPILLCCKTIIGYGSSLAGTHHVHGKVFTTEELKLIKKNLGWEDPAFTISADIYQLWHQSSAKGIAINNIWDAQLEEYGKKYPQLYSELLRRIIGELPTQLNRSIHEFIIDSLSGNTAIATRQSSKMFLAQFVQHLPELFGGSADLASSDGTLVTASNAFKRLSNELFNYLHFGVREFGMFCIMNGLALHKGFIPYGGTFLVFIDYARAALRLSAIMQQKIIYVLTHDSIGVGEDGPTHQPVEHLPMLRATPNLSVWRPADIIETLVAWQMVLNNDATSCLILSRQATPQLIKQQTLLPKIKTGGYVLHDPLDPVAIIIATGTEVHLAIQAAYNLSSEMAVRVVSMPNMGFFLSQNITYQEQVLPKNILARVAVEAASPLGWDRFVGANGVILGIDRFGLSAPAATIYQEFGLTVSAIEQAVKLALSRI